MTKQMISLELDDKLIARIEKSAEMKGLSRSAEIRMVLLEKFPQK